MPDDVIVDLDKLLRQAVRVRIWYENSSRTAWTAPLKRNGGLPFANLEGVAPGMSCARSRRGVINSDEGKRSSPVVGKNLVATDP